MEIGLRIYNLMILFVLVRQVHAMTVPEIGTAAGGNNGQGNGGKTDNSAGENRGNSSSEFSGTRRAMMVVEGYGNVSSVGEIEVYANGVRIGVSDDLAQFTFVGSRVRVGDVIGFWCGSDDMMDVGMGIVLKMGHVYWRSGESGMKCAWGVQRNGNWSRKEFSACGWHNAAIVHASAFSGTVMKGAKFIWAEDAPPSSDIGCRFVIGGEVCP